MKPRHFGDKIIQCFLYLNASLMIPFNYLIKLWALLYDTIRQSLPYYVFYLPELSNLLLSSNKRTYPHVVFFT